MPLDHYVSQVHLRNFNAPELDGLMYAFRKSDHKAFTPNSRAICRIEEGSTNDYLTDPRAVEEFLKGVEPNYNRAIDELVSGEIGAGAIYAIAGFVSYLVTCSPAGMRIQSKQIKSAVEEFGRAMDVQGLIGKVPSELGGSSFTELIDSGAINVNVDPKYPQAIGITSILQLASRFGNFKWEILINEHADSPFFTSDFPVAIERTSDPRVLNRIVPLTPSLAIRIHPDFDIDRDEIDFEFTNFGYRTKKASRKEVAHINTLIVQCAEDLVLYSRDLPWIDRFVKKNSIYWIEPTTHRIPSPTGALLVTTQRVKPKPSQE